LAKLGVFATVPPAELLHRLEEGDGNRREKAETMKKAPKIGALE
jgi:hypothetical protein